jgi:hypothetical protein
MLKKGNREDAKAQSTTNVGYWMFKKNNSEDAKA